MNVLVGTKQFKMILDEEFVNRLRSVAKRAGRDSAQHLAEEILTIYLPVYAAVSDSMRRAVEFQTKGLVPKREHVMNEKIPPGYEVRNIPLDRNKKTTDETVKKRKTR